MSSFLEKLKKGMAGQVGQEAGQEQEITPPETQPQDATFAAYKTRIPEFGQTVAAAKKTPRRVSRMITHVDDEEDTEENILKKTANKTAQPIPDSKRNLKKTMANKKPNQADTDSEWLNNEGQLAVDVYQTETDLVVQAAIAGMKVEDLDVLIEDEVITLKGNRPNPLQENGDYFIEECYWGNFSRKIIMPVEVDSSRADAAMKEGILTIRIPKIQREKKKKLVIK